MYKIAGVPQDGTVQAGQNKQYYLDLTNEHGVKSVTFTVTPVSGNVGLYVRSCPSSSVSETQCADNIPIATQVHCTTVTQGTPACYSWKSDGSWYDSESVEILHVSNGL